MWKRENKQPVPVSLSSSARSPTDQLASLTGGVSGYNTVTISTLV